MAGRLGSFDDLLLEIPPDALPSIAPTLVARRDVVFDSFPDILEVVRLGDRAASYGIGPKKMSESHVYLMPHRGHVTLGGYHGAELAGAGGLVEGTGKRKRHVNVHSVADAHHPDVRALVDAALAARRAALGLT